MKKQTFSVTQSILLIVLTTLRVFRAVRLKISFKGSIYEMSNELCMFLISAIGFTVVQSVLAILLAIISGSDDSQVGSDSPRAAHIVVASLGTLLLIQTLLDMFSCYRFNKNLLALTVMQRKSIILHHNNNCPSRHDQPRIHSVKSRSKSNISNMTLVNVHSHNEIINTNTSTNTRVSSSANDDNSNIIVNMNINRNAIRSVVIIVTSTIIVMLKILITLTRTIYQSLSTQLLQHHQHYQVHQAHHVKMRINKKMSNIYVIIALLWSLHLHTHLSN